jgi:hypothetical protein
LETDSFAVLSESAGFEIVDTGNADSPRLPPGASLGLRAFSQQVQMAQAQFGSTPATDFMESSEAATNAQASTCSACTTWQLKYGLLRSETAEQIEHLQQALSQLQRYFPSPKLDGLQVHGVVPDLQPPPVTARHRSRFSRLTSLSLEATNNSTHAGDSGESEGECYNARTTGSSTDESGAHSDCRAKIKVQRDAFVAREKRWKDLTSKLTSRLESKTHSVRALKKLLKRHGVEPDCI